MDDKNEIDTLNDGPETERWRRIVEQLTREGEHVTKAVELANVVARVKHDHEAEAAISLRLL